MLIVISYRAFMYAVSSPATQQVHFAVFVYATAVKHMYAPKIEEAIDSVTCDRLHNRWVEIQYWVDIPRATNESHIQMYTQ